MKIIHHTCFPFSQMIILFRIHTMLIDLPRSIRESLSTLGGSSKGVTLQTSNLSSLKWVWAFAWIDLSRHLLNLYARNLGTQICFFLSPHITVDWNEITSELHQRFHLKISSSTQIPDQDPEVHLSLGIYSPKKSQLCGNCEGEEKRHDSICSCC